MSPTKRSHSSIVSYAITLGGVALMFFLRLMLQPVFEYRQAYIFFFFVIMLSGWRFGWRPAALATVLSGVAGYWAFIPPAFAFGETHIADKIGLLVFFVLAGAFIALIEQTRRGAARAHSAAELDRQSALEHQHTIEALGKRDSQVRMVLEAAQFGTCEWNCADNTVIWSKEHYEILGHEPFSFQPRLEHFFERVHPDDIASVQGEFEAARNERRLVRVDFRAVLASGETRWLQAIGRYHHDERGDATSLSGLLLDVTKRKEYEESLRASRAQLLLVADTVPIGVVHCDAGRRFIFVNELYARQRGVRAQDCVGKHIWEVVGREAYEAFAPYVDAVLEGRAVEFEVQVPYQKIGPRFVHCAYVPEFDAAQRVCGFVCAVSDVTERRVSEEALRASEARLRSAMDAGKLGAWEWDIVNGHVTWSERIYSFHGIKPGEFDGTVESFKKLIHPEDAARVQDAIRSALEGRSSYEIEFRTVRPDGSIRWLATSARVIFNPAGKPERMLGGTIDLTERKETELALREAQSQLGRQAEHLEKLVEHRTAELQQTLQSVETLCYTIAHDLRAPLRAMQGFARALAEDFSGSSDSNAVGHTQRIMRAATRMDALITDLLAYGRLGTADITAHPVELDTALDAFLTDYAEEVKACHATICVERLMPMVLANRTLLGQVLANLLLNAMKFVAPGTAPQIRVYAEPLGERVRLNVEDNGIGIAPEYAAKLFQIFQRLHGPEQYAGTGMGLAIVKKAVERMNGSVGFNSTPGKGSTFWIELPGGGVARLPSTAASAPARTSS